MAQDQYREEEWEAAVGHQPLGDLSFMDIGLLHWRWIWADRCRLCFLNALKRDGEDAAFDAETGDPRLHSDSWLFMYLWYGLLYAVIEALAVRKIDLRAPLQGDIDLLSDRLRLTRNAVFHVPDPGDGGGLARGGYHDERLTRLMRTSKSDWSKDPEIVPALYRVHGAIGRLLLEESRRRTSDEVHAAELSRDA